MVRDFQTRKNRLQKRKTFLNKVTVALKASSSFKLTMF